VTPDRRLALSQEIEDVDRRLEDGTRARPPLAGELSGLASLVDLDSGLADADVNTDGSVRPSSIMAQLVIPDARHNDARHNKEQLLRHGPASVSEPARTTGYVSTRMTALGLMLTQFFGAASAAVVQEPPPEAPVQGHTLPTKPETRETGKVEPIEELLKFRHEELAEGSRAPEPEELAEGSVLPELAVFGQDSLTARIAELKQTLETIAQQLAAH
jgi:hypothetical protein